MKTLLFLIAALLGFATHTATAIDIRFGNDRYRPRMSCGHDYYHRECSRCVRRSDDSYRYGSSNGYRERVIYYYQSYDSRWYCPQRRFYIRCR